MKTIKQIAVLLLTMLIVSGCNSSNEHEDYGGDMVCQKELKDLMGDQPSFVSPPWCDSLFVLHLQAAR